MNHRPPPAAAVAALGDAEVPTDHGGADTVSPRPGQGVARTGARVRAREDVGAPEIVRELAATPSADMFRSGHADDRLRRALARLRRSRDAEVRAAGDALAAEAAEMLLALAERAVQADPVTQRRLARAVARQSRLEAQLDGAVAAREEARRAHR